MDSASSQYSDIAVLYDLGEAAGDAILFSYREDIKKSRSFNCHFNHT